MDKALKPIIKYLKNKKNPFAIVTNGGELIWSSNNSIWESAVAMLSIPINPEKSVCLTIDGEKCPITAVPYEVDLKSVVFILEAYDYKTMAFFIKKSGLVEKLKESLKISSGYIREISDFGMYINHCYKAPRFNKAGIKNAIDLQQSKISDLLAQNMNSDYFLYDDVNISDKTRTDVKAIIDTIYEICLDELPVLDGAIEYRVIGNEGLIKIHERTFSLMIMNLIQNVLLNSTKNPKINISLNFSLKNVIIIIKGNKVVDKVADSGLGIEVARNICESIGGKLKYIETVRKSTATITLPLSKRNEQIGFQSKILDIADDKFTVFKLFLNKIHDTKFNNEND